jgi:hypothetical protein
MGMTSCAEMEMSRSTEPPGGSASTTYSAEELRANHAQLDHVRDGRRAGVTMAGGQLRRSDFVERLSSSRRSRPGVRRDALGVEANRPAGAG